MKKFFSKLKTCFYRFFIESDNDRINRERQEQGKAPFIFW